MDSLFSSWSNMVGVAGNKVVPIESAFNALKSVPQEVVVAVDGSGSTLFNNTLAYDGKGFSSIYIEALKKLHENLPNHEIIAWSNSAIPLTGHHRSMYDNCITNGIPFTDQISQMNQGTAPQSILPLVRGKTVVLVTDGEILDRDIAVVRSGLPTSGITSVYLVIVPHIDNYPNLYRQNVESNAMESIRLSIPQAFSSCLATVLVWNYKTREYIMISDLTAPWVDKSKSLLELLSANCVRVLPGEFTIKIGDSMKSFSLSNLLSIMKQNTISEELLLKLKEYGVHLAIRQQGNEEDANNWNNVVQPKINELLEKYLQKESVGAPDENCSLLDRIKWSVQNQAKENELMNNFYKEFGCLIITKTVGQITSIGAAKAAQTNANVANFQKLDKNEKLTAMTDVLVRDECTICGIEQNVFSTVAFPSQTLLQMKNCVRQIKQKKRTITILDPFAMRDVLSNDPPRLHCTKLCVTCANTCLNKAHHPSDPEYGITNLYPSNMQVINGINTVVTRLLLYPLIDPKFMTETSNPNDPKVSFTRQMMRAFMSQHMQFDVAGADCMNAIMMVLTCLATDKEKAEIIFANQVSLLRGGKVDRYRATVGRLFYPLVGKISPEVLTQIAIVEPVVEMAELPVLAESKKLLLWCSIGRKINILLNASKMRAQAVNKLDETLTTFQNTNKFGMTNEMVEEIKNAPSIEAYKSTYPENITKFLAYYMQNTMNADFAFFSRNEESMRKIMAAQSLIEIAHGLNIDITFLEKMVTGSGMTPQEFMSKIPNFVKAMVGVEGDISKVIDQFC